MYPRIPLIVQTVIGAVGMLALFGLMVFVMVAEGPSFEAGLGALTFLSGLGGVIVRFVLVSRANARAAAVPLQPPVQPPPPSAHNPWTTYDVRRTGITAHDGVTWLPAPPHARVEALLDPDGRLVHTVRYVNNGPDLLHSVELRSPDGRPMGRLVNLMVNQAFALQDATGRPHAYLQGDLMSGGLNLELLPHGGGPPFGRVYVVTDLNAQPTGTVAIHRDAPGWMTQLCSVFVLSYELIVERPTYGGLGGLF